MHHIETFAAAATLMLGLAGPAASNEVQIIDAKAIKAGENWTISVTLKHADEGWDHYADLWQVETKGGEVLGSRVLAHPHVNEQPFTRSLGGVAIPADATRVIIRARDSVHGWSTQRFELLLR